MAICLVVQGCGSAKNPALPHTSPAGSIDWGSNPLWGKPIFDMLPQPDGRPLDPTQGLGVQESADRLIGRHVADFVVHGRDMLLSGVEINNFYPAATAGPGPGMCEARRFQITAWFSGSRVMETSEGKWLEPVYAVSGSLAPFPEERARDYRRRLEQACRQRSDTDRWFGAESDWFATAPERAYLGARLVDAVVAAARQQGKLPFSLQCRPYTFDSPYRPQRAADVRKTAASLNPRAILEVRACNDEPRRNCVGVELAKFPEHSPPIEYRWDLEIRFDATDGLMIKDVALADTHLLID
ncbi:hypothetical protein [Allosphingosinicella deserti]|nr:hypothetical protein [Sphingomonas deserti]